MQQLSIASFLAHGHGYHLYTYGPVKEVPEGTTVLDGNTIIPAQEVFPNCDADTYTVFSDYFRYSLLHRKGGWWVDTDLVCLQRFAFSSNYVFSSEHTEEAGREVVNVGAIKVPPAAPVMSYTELVCRTKDPARIGFGELGPALMAEAVHRYALKRHVLAAGVFCPVPWFRFTDFLDARRELTFGPETYAVHLWHERWRANRFDSGAAYHPECAYERWKERYLPERGAFGGV
jgi:hypothetical protein